MITLTMVLCLLSSPTDCRESKLQFAQQGLSVYACAMKGQAQIADPKKNVLREGEFVARYRCEKAGMFAKIWGDSLVGDSFIPITWATVHTAAHELNDLVSRSRTSAYSTIKFSALIFAAAALLI